MYYEIKKIWSKHLIPSLTQELCHTIIIQYSLEIFDPRNIRFFGFSRNIRFWKSRFRGCVLIRGRKFFIKYFYRKKFQAKIIFWEWEIQTPLNGIFEKSGFIPLFWEKNFLPPPPDGERKIQGRKNFQKFFKPLEIQGKFPPSKYS